jgi:dipeptidyl aminopeptidase/acylaminoacyl peptidase
MDWLEQWFAKADLPEKIFLHGHSYGGYLSALFT